MNDDDPGTDIWKAIMAYLEAPAAARAALEQAVLKACRCGGQTAADPQVEEDSRDIRATTAD